MKLYGLSAKGPLKWTSGSQTLYSRKLYKSKESAESNKNYFIEKCLDSGIGYSSFFLT